jgi:hypothetical protein
MLLLGNIASKRECCWTLLEIKNKHFRGEGTAIKKRRMLGEMLETKTTTRRMLLLDKTTIDSTYATVLVFKSTWRRQRPTRALRTALVALYPTKITMTRTMLCGTKWNANSSICDRPVTHGQLSNDIFLVVAW